MATKKAAAADAPPIIVECVNARCSQKNVQQTVPAGVMVTNTIIATYNLNCAVCGSSLLVTRPA
ncbi:MAG TPA: hypothetical protein VFT75_18610 [Nocardioidaceae bacterium]|nr:hypothetical protein [Nocardioidaceae bacterium]